MAVTPTTITTEDQIYLAGSPINLRIRNLAGDANIQSVVCELYVWSGNLNSPPSLPSYILETDKVSASDNYINFQIAEILASHINKTKFAWISGDNQPSIAGEGVFFQYKYQVTSATVEAPIESLTNFATMGWRWDYEQVGDVALSTNKQPYLGLIGYDYNNRNYNCNIKYYIRFFNFAGELEDTTSESMILWSGITPSNTKAQLADKYLVVYINRWGLWDYFTPFGKSIKSIKVGSETNPRLYRNPNSINNSVNHSKSRQIETSDQTYVLNSGDLTELMTEQVEEVIYSPLVYLIEFTGEQYTVIQEGITVDSTEVTVDSTLYTVDNNTVTTEDLGYYSTFKQIPVVCVTENFVKKTRLNDKGKINYDLQFDATVGRINNLR